MVLESELEAFRSQLIDMLGVNNINEGKYAVAFQNDVIGPFETYENALSMGYDKFGLRPFLVKKIERCETVMYFSRELV